MKTTILSELNDTTEIKLLLPEKRGNSKIKENLNTESFKFENLTEFKLAEMFSAKKCWIQDKNKSISLNFTEIMEISMNWFITKKSKGRYHKFCIENNRIEEEVIDGAFENYLDNTIVINRFGVVLYDSCNNSSVEYLPNATLVRTEYGCILHHKLTNISVILKKEFTTEKSINRILDILYLDDGTLRILSEQGLLTVLSHHNNKDYVEQLTIGEFVKKILIYRINPTLVLNSLGFPCWTSGFSGIYNYSGATLLTDSDRPKIYCSARTGRYYEFKNGRLGLVNSKGTLQTAKNVMSNGTKWD